MLYDYANGFDDSPVRLFSEREKIKSVGNGTTFSRDLVGINDIKTAVTSLADTAARLMEATVLPPDPAGQDCLTALIGATVRDIPAFTLTCTPDVSAAQLAYEFLSQV
jgi:nucleotidyltransferase/DNA polymerase involved in DNA repair